eukprot:PhF_6_TR27903/c0_g1_i1/m.40923
MIRRCRGWAEFLSSTTLDLVLALRSNNLEEVTKALSFSSTNVNVADVDNDGNTPLHYAVHHNNLEMLCTLLSSKKILLLPNSCGCTALHVAAQYCVSPLFVQVLIAAFGHSILCDLDSRDNNVLHLLCSNKRIDPVDNAELVRKLLKGSASHNLTLFRAKNKQGCTPLDTAALQGSAAVELQRTLLSFGARRAVLWDAGEQFEVMAQESRRRDQIEGDQERMWECLLGDIAWSAAQWGEWMNVRREHLKQVELNLQTIIQLESQLRKDVEAQHRAEHTAFVFLHRQQRVEIEQRIATRGQENAATKIQCVWKGLKQRIFYSQQREKMMEERRRAMSWVKVTQPLGRAYVTRKWLGISRLQAFKRLMAAVKVQKLFRGYKARILAQELRHSLEEHRQVEIREWARETSVALNNCVRTIQRFLQAVPQRKLFLLFRRKTIVMQGWWRQRQEAKIRKENASRARSANVLQNWLKKQRFFHLLQFQIRSLRRRKFERKLDVLAADVQAHLQTNPVQIAPAYHFHTPTYNAPRKKKKSKDPHKLIILYEGFVHVTLIGISVLVVCLGVHPSFVYFDTIGVVLIGMNILGIIAAGKRSPFHLLTRLWDVACVVSGCLGIAGVHSQGSVLMYTMRLPALIEPTIAVMNVVKEMLPMAFIPFATLLASLYVSHLAHPTLMFAQFILPALLRGGYVSNSTPSMTNTTNSTNSTTFDMFSNTTTSSPSFNPQDFVVLSTFLNAGVELAFLGATICAAVRVATQLEQSSRRVLIRDMQAEIEKMNLIETLNNVMDWEGSYALSSRRVDDIDAVQELTPGIHTGENIFDLRGISQKWSYAIEMVRNVMKDPTRQGNRLYWSTQVLILSAVITDILTSFSRSHSTFHATNLVFLILYCIDLILSTIVVVFRKKCLPHAPTLYCVLGLMLRALMIVPGGIPRLIPLRGLRTLDLWFYAAMQHEGSFIRPCIGVASLLMISVWVWYFLFRAASASDSPPVSVFNETTEPIVIIQQIILKFVIVPMACAFGGTLCGFHSYFELVVQAYVRIMTETVWDALHVSHLFSTNVLKSLKHRWKGSHHSLQTPRGRGSMFGNSLSNYSFVSEHGHAALKQQMQNNAISIASPSPQRQRTRPPATTRYLNVRSLSAFSILSRLLCCVTCAMLFTSEWGVSSIAVDVIFGVHAGAFVIEYGLLLRKGWYHRCTTCSSVELGLIGVVIAGLPYTRLRPLVLLRLLTSVCSLTRHRFVDVHAIEFLATLHNVFLILSQKMFFLASCLAIGILLCGVALTTATFTLPSLSAFSVVDLIVASPALWGFVSVLGFVSLSRIHGDAYLTNAAILWRQRFHYEWFQRTTPPTPNKVLFVMRFAHILTCISVILHIVFDDVELTTTRGFIAEILLSGVITVCDIAQIIFMMVKLRYVHISVIVFLLFDFVVFVLVIGTQLQWLLHNWMLCGFALRVWRIVWFSTDQVKAFKTFLSVMVVVFVCTVSAAFVGDISVSHVFRILTLNVVQESQTVPQIVCSTLLRVVSALLLSTWIRTLDIAHAAPNIDAQPLCVKDTMMLANYPLKTLKQHVAEVHDAGYPHVPHPVMSAAGMSVFSTLMQYVEAEWGKLIQGRRGGSVETYKGVSLAFVVQTFSTGLPILCPQQCVHWCDVLFDGFQHHLVVRLQSIVRRLLVVRRCCHSSIPMFQMHRELFVRTWKHQLRHLKRLVESKEEEELDANFPSVPACTYYVHPSVFRNLRIIPQHPRPSFNRDGRGGHADSTSLSSNTVQTPSTNPVTPLITLQAVHPIRNHHHVPLNLQPATTECAGHRLSVSNNTKKSPRILHPRDSYSRSETDQDNDNESEEGDRSSSRGSTRSSSRSSRSEVISSSGSFTRDSSFSQKV